MTDIPDRKILDEYLNTIIWYEIATDREKTLVRGNLENFYHSKVLPAIKESYEEGREHCTAGCVSMAFLDGYKHATNEINEKILSLVSPCKDCCGCGYTDIDALGNQIDKTKCMLCDGKGVVWKDDDVKFSDLFKTN